MWYSTLKLGNTGLFFREGIRRSFTQSHTKIRGGMNRVWVCRLFRLHGRYRLPDRTFFTMRPQAAERNCVHPQSLPVGDWFPRGFPPMLHRTTPDPYQPSGQPEIRGAVCPERHSHSQREHGASHNSASRTKSGRKTVRPTFHTRFSQNLHHA